MAARHNAAMPRCLCLVAAAVVAVATAGCATRAADVAPVAASAADFAGWDCPRIDHERDRVQLRAADVAYAVDARVGRNIVALGVGLAVFWPAIVALQPDGPEAAELARLKGRFEALDEAARERGCPPPGPDLPPERRDALPLAIGEALIYEERAEPRRAPSTAALRVAALRRAEIEFRGDADGDVWRQDLAGNIVAAPLGALTWPRLLRAELELGQVTAGDIVVVGDPLARARMRGQVVAVGPQTVAGRRFDVAVIELYGDAERGEAFTRVDGVIAIDRASGVLLRLDLRSAQPSFSLQRRLMRIEPAPPQ